MKYLSDYTQEAQTALFEKTGTFFAFGQKQFAEKVQPGVKYTQCGAGMICPAANTRELMTGLNAIHKAAVKLDIKENGLHGKGIIYRELANHECWYTGDISDAIDALEPYRVTIAEIQKVYRDNFEEASNW